MLEHIHVAFEVYATDFSIKKALKALNSHSMISYDCETQSLFSKEEKAEAKALLKANELSYEDKKFCKQVAGSSGLSNPRLSKVTHFIFGTSKEHSIIMIANNRKTEIMIFEWLAQYQGKVLLWNALFDLKIMHQKIGKLPLNYDDGMLLLKSLVNDTKDWNAKVGLKDFMGQYYDPKWSLIETYDIKDFKDEAFLRYCSIDGAATYYGWELIQEQLSGEER